MGYETLPKAKEKNPMPDPAMSLDANASQRMTSYRWVVLVIIFAFYFMNFADRTNVGVVLPLVTKVALPEATDKLRV